MSLPRPAVLALEDGSVFHGQAFGAAVTVVGECVFNTSMTGYQEIVTDPSYWGQIVTMTAPQIGNYGVNADDAESLKPMAAALVVRELSPLVSNWRSQLDLSSYLAKHGIPGISGVDTRAITKKLRVTGAMNCCLSCEGLDDAEAVRRAKTATSIVGADYVKVVSTRKAYRWDPASPKNAGYFPAGTTLGASGRPARTFRVAAFDYGAKHSIFAQLVRHGFDVEVLPATATAEEVEALRPDGIFLSNGPGDPAALPYIHTTVTALIPKYPIFGICLGHQILTHAFGATTFKLKFGHRGGNQPVKNLETGQVSITAQNHGFASDERSLARQGVVVTEINLNDGTVEGLRHKELPVFSVQYHPEAAPGPNDAVPHFQRFHELVAARKDGRL
jgi:carbamoyl-phosphate synthase small subunit